VNEVLGVPEDCLEEVIKVIRAGLKQEKVSGRVKRNLSKWCKEEEEYLKRLQED
jgi:hypothetical protein